MLQWLESQSDKQHIVFVCHPDSYDEFPELVCRLRANNCEFLVGKSIVDILKQLSNQNYSFNGSTNPFKGLFSYEYVDRNRFFGRDEEVERLINALSFDKPLLLSGASGSGKSSILKAGVLPKLIDKHHAFFYTVSEPLNIGENIEYWIRTELDDNSSSDSAAIVIIDQCEQLFDWPDNVWQAWIDALLEYYQHTEKLYLLLGIRSDAEYKLKQHSGFKTSTTYTAETLSSEINVEQWYKIINSQAQYANFSIDDALLNRLVEDAIQSNGNLPLVSLLLETLYEKSKNLQITLEDYPQKEKGLKGIINAQANLAMVDFTLQEKSDYMPILFQLLIDVNDIDASTARSKTLIVGDTTPEVISHMAEALFKRRLLRKINSRKTLKDEVAYRIAHESLITGWKEVTQWIKNDFAFQLWLNTIRQMNGAWNRADKNADYLIKGKSQLNETSHYIDSKYEALSCEANDPLRFLQTSIHQGKKEKKLRLAAASFLTSAIILLGLGVFWFAKSADEQQQSAAVTNEVLNQSIELMDRLLEKNSTSPNNNAQSAQIASQLIKLIEQLDDERESISIEDKFTLAKSQTFVIFSSFRNSNLDDALRMAESNIFLLSSLIEVEPNNINFLRLYIENLSLRNKLIEQMGQLDKTMRDTLIREVINATEKASLDEVIFRTFVQDVLLNQTLAPYELKNALTRRNTKQYLTAYLKESEEIYLRNSFDTGARLRLVNALVGMGEWHNIKGNINEALEHYQRGIKLLKEVPENDARKHDLLIRGAQFSMKFSELLFKTDKLVDAIEYLDDYTSQLQNLYITYGDIWSFARYLDALKMLASANGYYLQENPYTSPFNVLHEIFTPVPIGNDAFQSAISDNMAGHATFLFETVKSGNIPPQFIDLAIVNYADIVQVISIEQINIEELDYFINKDFLFHHENPEAMIVREYKKMMMLSRKGDVFAHEFANDTELGISNDYQTAKAIYNEIVEKSENNLWANVPLIMDNKLTTINKLAVLEKLAGNTDNFINYMLLTNELARTPMNTTTEDGRQNIYSRLFYSHYLVAKEYLKNNELKCTKAYKAMEDAYSEYEKTTEDYRDYFLNTDVVNEFIDKLNELDNICATAH